MVSMTPVSSEGVFGTLTKLENARNENPLRNEIHVNVMRALVELCDQVRTQYDAERAQRTWFGRLWDDLTPGQAVLKAKTVTEENLINLFPPTQQSEANLALSQLKASGLIKLRSSTDEGPNGAIFDYHEWLEVTSLGKELLEVPIVDQPTHIPNHL